MKLTLLPEGRKNLVANAVGIKNFNGVTYNTTVEEVTGLLPISAEG
jgi:hypothetical protein